jgi:hypothetical protein
MLLRCFEGHFGSGGLASAKVCGESALWRNPSAPEIRVARWHTNLRPKNPNFGILVVFFAAKTFPNLLTHK